MAETPSTQPLNRLELSSHITEMQATDPTAISPGSDDDLNHPGNLSYTSYDQLNRAIERVDASLTESIEEGDHMLTQEAFDALLVDAKDVERLARERINDLEQAVGDHDTLIRTVKAYERWEEDDTDGVSIPFEVPDKQLSAGDMARPIRRRDMVTYLDAKQQEFEDRMRGRADNGGIIARHRSSTRLVEDLVNQWHYNTAEVRQARRDGREPNITLEFGNEHYDSMFNAVRATHEQHTRLTQQRIRNLGNEVLDATGIRLRREGGTEAIEERQPATPQVEAPQTSGQEVPATQAGDTMERARNSELFSTVVRQAKGKTSLNVDVINGFRWVGDVPESGRQVANMPTSVVRDLEKSSNWRDHPNEAFSFTEIVEPDTISTYVPGRVERGLFGKKVEIPGSNVPKPNPNAGEPKLTRNVVTRRDEPIVRFRYQFNYSVRTVNSREAPQYTIWRGGRDGQHVMLGVDLPKSVADILQDRIEQDLKEGDPTSLREIVEQLVLKNNDANLTKDAWLKGRAESSRPNPIRPPYEDLPDDWKITILRGKETSDGTVQKIKTPDGKQKYDTDQLPHDTELPVAA